MHGEIFYLAEACLFGGFVGKGGLKPEDRDTPRQLESEAHQQPEASSNPPL